MKHFTLLALMLTLAAGSAGKAAAAIDDPIETAKSLYMSASYSEALAALANLPAGTDLDAADKYRALCFLGLDKAGEADKALESLVRRHPLYTMDSSESPKLVTMFKATRARTLPGVARTMFASAKDAFARKELTEASSQFSDLMKVLAVPELASASELADLRMLADGFSKLTEQQLLAEKTTPPPAPAVASPSAAAKSAPPPGAVYNIEDDGITPPVPLVQTMPMWTPPNDNFRRVTFTGAVEVLIDERGAVESARMIQPINALYDQLLVAAARNWRYTPAMRQGQPVKYRKQIKVNLKPTGSGASGE
jgi:TonB family protein